MLAEEKQNQGRGGDDVQARILAKGLPVQGRICEDSVLITILTNSLERANKIHKEDIELDKLRSVIGRAPRPDDANAEDPELATQDE